MIISILAAIVALGVLIVVHEFGHFITAKRLGIGVLKFSVGFGPEADLRIHREEITERDEAGLLGGWNTQTVRVAIRLSNLGGDKRQIEITERIPISEVEQVQVEAGAPDAYLLEDEPGREEITQSRRVRSTSAAW